MSGVRRILGIGAAAGAVAIALVEACGLGVVGTATEAGVGPEGGGGEGGGFPDACATVDAACLGALPPGWIPLVVTDAGCPPAFDPGVLETNPRLRDGGCLCGACEVLDSRKCPSAVAVGGGSSCDPSLGMAEAGVCFDAGGHDFVAPAPDAAGVVSCVSAELPGAGSTGDPISVCVPTCAADPCAAHVQCIFAEHEVDCPPGFSLLLHGGTEIATSCATCPCEAGAPSACVGTITAYRSSSCDPGAGPFLEAPLDTCAEINPSQDFNSVLVDLAPADASCAPTAPFDGTGDAGLVGTKTVCCR